MGSDDTLAVVRAYHRGWTSKQFNDAVELLAADLSVEVPINSYPTRDSFAEALINFGSLATSVELLSELSARETRRCCSTTWTSRA